MARPTKYKPEYIHLVNEYLQGTGREATELPTVEGFAQFLGVDTDTINNWCKAKTKEGNLKHPEFFGAIKRLKDKQKNQLINDGLYGGKEVNAAMAIFLLKANHNLVETDRHEHMGKDGEPLTVKVVSYKSEK